VKRNGELYVSRRLDRESTAVYKLEVVASDGTFVTTCRVTIDILDDNDSPPTCARGLYKEAVSESAAPGTYLVNIKAFDADEGINAKQAFYLTGQDSELFSIDRDTGMIKTLHPLDRERSASHVFLAHAQDAGVPEWECVSQVEITVLDTNDNSPAWAQSVFSASIKEDVSVGTIVAKVHATDADSGDNRKLRYAIVDSASLDHETFKIDAVSGIVSLAKPVDREVKAMYNLTLRATDNGKPKLTSSSNLVVLVLDINDNPPVFVSKMYSASVNENTPVGANVVHVQATSKDTGVNAEVSYSIVAGNEHRKFKINPKSGVIVVSGELDHEKGREYLLTIQAQDGGDPPLSNHASVNITVLDENDNAPVFSQGSYSATVNEAASMGHGVAVVSATDPDSGDNGRINFAIVGGDRHKQFSVDANSGHIRVASALDREMVSNYVLEVQAFDHGRPNALTATVLVNVEVLDANDSPPVFPEGNYTAYLSEGKPLGKH
jgi:protocadherin Fat 1/2/3